VWELVVCNWFLTSKHPHITFLFSGCYNLQNIFFNCLHHTLFITGTTGDRCQYASCCPKISVLALGVHVHPMAKPKLSDSKTALLWPQSSLYLQLTGVVGLLGFYEKINYPRLHLLFERQRIDSKRDDSHSFVLWALPSVLTWSWLCNSGICSLEVIIRQFLCKAGYTKTVAWWLPCCYRGCFHQQFVLTYRIQQCNRMRFIWSCLRSIDNTFLPQSSQ